jgi:hypothetical protein
VQTPSLDAAPKLGEQQAIDSPGRCNGSQSQVGNGKSTELRTKGESQIAVCNRFVAGRHADLEMN